MRISGRNGFSQRLIERGAGRSQAMTIETEDDRREHLAGLIRPADYLVTRCPAEVAEPLHEQRRALQASFDQRYGRPDTAYRVTNAIVARLQHDLQHGGMSVAELVDRAVAELETMSIDGAEDTVFKLGGHLRIQALRVAYDWFTTGAHAAPATALRDLVRPVEEAFHNGTLQPTLAPGYGRRGPRAAGRVRRGRRKDAVPTPRDGAGDSGAAGVGPGRSNRSEIGYSSTSS